MGLVTSWHNHITGVLLFWLYTTAGPSPKLHPTEEQTSQTINTNVGLPPGHHLHRAQQILSLYVKEGPCAFLPSVHHSIFLYGSTQTWEEQAIIYQHLYFCDTP